MNKLGAIVCFLMSLLEIVYPFFVEKAGWRPHTTGTAFLWYTAGLFYLDRDSK